MAKKATKVKQVATVETQTDVVTDIQRALDGLDATMSKSAKIRALAGMGFERGPIAKVLGIRYQHVRNVLITPIKRPVKE